MIFLLGKAAKMTQAKENIMFIYKITREYDQVNYDENAGFVVIASSEVDARNVIFRSFSEYDQHGCRVAGGDEGAAVWLDEEASQCLQIGRACSDQVACIVLTDFRAG